MSQNKYNVEFTMHIYDSSSDELKDCLAGLCADLSLDEGEENNGKGKIIKIHLRTDDPHLVFDTCSQFGRLKSVKIEEIKEG